MKGNLMSVHTEVLIAGGGTVGLATADLLGYHGVRATVVERHPRPRSHPRATGVGQRTAEIFRQLGLQDQLDEASVDLSRSVGSLTVDTLAAAVEEADVDAILDALPQAGVARARSNEAGPIVPLGICPQDRLDRILLDDARRRGAEVLFGTEAVSIRQHSDHVEVVLSGPAGTATRQFAYVVAADGANSELREQLGIAVDGPGTLGEPLVNIYFRADLTALTRGIRFVTCTITHAGAEGTLVTIDGIDHWVFHTSYRPAAGQSPADFTEARCRSLIRSAIGVPKLDVDIIDVLPWQVTAHVAERLDADRVFLVGDAAHTIPPIGAFGMNTGIADAHNLAWKLAYVLDGRAGTSLLATYTTERQPVAIFTMQQALIRLTDPRLHWDRSPAMADARAAAGAANAPVVQLGYRYSSTAVIDARPIIPSMEDITADLDGAPGSRVPHRWLDGDGQRRSTLDLAGPHFALMIAPAGMEWSSAIDADDAIVDLSIIDDDPTTTAERGWEAQTGTDADGALLVRPDGIIAWRVCNTPPTPSTALRDALNRILDRADTLNA
jgi:putative polyketide hydroxylase